MIFGRQPACLGAILGYNFNLPFMSGFCRFVAGLSLLFVGLAQADPGPMSIWFTNAVTPGDTGNWQQWALPVGNGKLGAMIYGGIGSEQIQFNEDTVWGGQPHDYTNPNGSATHLATLQADCFSFTSDSTMLSVATSYLMGVPIREAAFQPAGTLMLNFPQSSGTSNYLRTLDLNSATVNVHYDYNSVTYNRDIFASAPSNHVIVLHFTASQPNSVTFTCSFSTLQTANSIYATGHDLVMHAIVYGVSDSRYYSGTSPALTNGVQYDARVRVIATGGTVTTTSSSISVTNANDAVLLLSVASNVKSYSDITADYVTICSNNIAAAAAVGFSSLRLAQTNDYENLFNRVVLDLGGNSRTNSSIGYRKKQMALDGNDPQLVALDFQLGRYLMISSSRPGSQPSNLQGKWNDVTNASWDSKMTININEEMNYWGAEVCNLSECTLPLFDMMNDLSVTGHKVATSTYGVSSSLTNAWVVHHNTDLWRDAAPCNGNDGIWPTGAAWLCQHVWWHYLYTGDTNWLATNGYPLMKGAAQFFQGFLVTNKYSKFTSWPSTYTNWLVTCPSYSPEHSLSNVTAQVASPTMDNELCRDLLTHVIAACQVLNTDATFSATCSNLMAQLPPDQIGGLGQLQEWLQDYEDAGHRHCSHLVGLFPGDEISTYYSQGIAAAAKHSVDLRGYANSSLTPWSCSWRFNLRTRLQDGDGAWTNLLYLYGYSKVATNLIYADNNRQLDSIFGRLSGIANFFLQSPRGEIILLPALPTQLSTNGMVSGLCAAGGFEVDNLTWTNGQLTGATILSKVGNVCNLRSQWPIIVMQGGNVVSAPMVLPGLYQFSTIAGNSYTILPATTAEVENLFATTSGAAQQIVTNGAFSNWRGAQFNAAATGNSVTYAVSNLAAGNYHLYITANAGTNCGQFQLSCGSIGGALVNVGTTQDTYSPTNVAYLLPIKITTTTNLIVLWTNMQREFDCGNWSAPSNGNYNFKFTVAGKNAASAGYALTLDYIKFAPADVAPPPNQPPFAPTNLAPTSAAVNQPIALTLQASAFLDPDNGDTQAAGEWLVWRTSDNTLVFDSGTDTVDTTSFTLPANSLDYGANYNWQTRYEDNHGAWSAYSATTSFSTVAPMLNSGSQAGGLVFCWPTNSTGFVLECTTNLFPPNWVPAAVTPVKVNGFYTVTNPPDSGNMFFRLDKP
jgi:alpha-L-fucosidase 2